MNPLQIVRYMTQSPLRGAAIGGAAGAASAAVQKNEDGSRKSLLRGAVRGAAVGGALAGAGRAYRDTRLLRPELGAVQAAGATVQRAGKGLADFGRRQVHGFTGAHNPDAIGMHGLAHSKQKIDLLQRRLADDIKHAPTQAPALREAFQQEAAALERSGASAQKIRDAGLQSIPSAAKALADPALRGKALRAMGTTVAGGGGKAGLALGVGLPVAMQAPSLMRGDESDTGGASMKRKLVALGGSIGAGALTAGLPIIPQLVAGTAIDTGVQKLTQPRKVAP
jgi:hypothetical protein